MKDKEKQIEEMAIIISGSTEIDTIEYYNALIKAKQIYEIIFPKDSIVLSKEEQDKILKATKSRINKLKGQVKQARKETAKEILDLIAKIIKEEYGGEPPCNFNCNDEYMFDNCDEFCCEYCNTPDNEKNYERCWIEFFKSKMKKYGVEVEE